MTSAEDILHTLCEEPESDILAAMLTDALMEERGMLRTEADIAVRRVRKDARDSLDMATVKAILAERGERWMVIHEEVSAACGFATDTTFFLYVVTGQHPPSVAVRPGPNEGGTPDAPWTVGVPAGWALQMLRSRGHSTAKPKRRR